MSFFFSQSALSVFICPLSRYSLNILHRQLRHSSRIKVIYSFLYLFTEKFEFRFTLEFLFICVSIHVLF